MSRTMQYFASLVVCALLAACTSNDPVSAAATGSLSGTVSGDAVDGVVITVSGPESHQTVTDTNGDYLVEDLLPGLYTVTPSSPGAVFTPPSRMILSAGDALTGLDFSSVVPPPQPTVGNGTIRGTISGLVVADLDVTLSGPAVKTTTTDALGDYEFVDLPPGTYTVTPTRPGLIFTPASADVDSNDDDVTGVDFDAAPAPPPPPPPGP